MQHCFIVDDSDIIRRFTRLIFENLDFRVSEAENPANAIERLKTDSPDIILVDWRIPGANMFEFISLVRKMPLSSRPTIIYMPTENDEADIQRATSAGADTYLLKPFNTEIVQMKLQDLKSAA